MKMDRSLNAHELNRALETLNRAIFLINRLTLSETQFALSEITKDELKNDISPALSSLYQTLKQQKEGVDLLERSFKQTKGDTNAK